MLEKLLNELGDDLDMKDLIIPSEDKHFHLPFANNITVEVIELQKNYLLKGLIGSCPEHNKEAFLLKAMEANLFGIGTRGAVIGLSDDEKLLTLSRELEYNNSYKNFKEKLEDFVSVIDVWREEALNHQ